jgi:hypothetical protein
MANLESRIEILNPPPQLLRSTGPAGMSGGPVDDSAEGGAGGAAFCATAVRQ